MDRFLSFFKAHPLWIIGGVVAVIVFWYIAGRSGSSAPSYGVMRAGPTDAQVAGNTAESIARIQANAVTVQGQNAIELAKVESVNVLAALGASKDITETQANRDISIAGIMGKTSTDNLKIQADATTAVAGLQATLGTHLANIDWEKFKLGSTLAAAASDKAAQAAVDVARINADNDQATLQKKLNASFNWEMWMIPGNMSALWGQPVSNTNVTNNGQMSGVSATGGA